MSCSDLVEMTPADVEAMGLSAVVASIFEDVTRASAVNTYEGNDLIEQVQTTTDAYETLMGTVTAGFTYYPTGEVDQITITTRDSEGEIIDSYTIKHYKGLKQPEIVEG